MMRFSIYFPSLLVTLFLGILVGGQLEHSGVVPHEVIVFGALALEALVCGRIVWIRFNEPPPGTPRGRLD